MSTLRATTYAGVVFLIENGAEEYIVPIYINITKIIYSLLGSGGKSIPSACLVGVKFSQFIKDISYPTLVLTISVITAQEVKFQTNFLV